MPKADWKIVNGKRKIYVYDAMGEIAYIFQGSELNKASKRAGRS